MTFDAFKTQDTKLQRTFKGHLGSIARVAFHPKLPVCARLLDGLRGDQSVVTLFEVARSATDGRGDA